MFSVWLDSGVYSLNPPAARRLPVTSLSSLPVTRWGFQLDLNIVLGHILIQMTAFLVVVRRMSDFCQLHVLSAPVRSSFFSVLSEKSRV